MLLAARALLPLNFRTALVLFSPLSALCGIQTQTQLAATQERNSRAVGKLEESLAGEFSSFRKARTKSRTVAVSKY